MRVTYKKIYHLAVGAIRNKKHKGVVMNIKLPIGIENFEEFRTEGFYYVDKTKLIKDLLENWGKVNLFTRPRRFGKSLNMSMLKYFFEIGCNKTLFDGLAISAERELCEKYMGQFPVISVSLKGIDGSDFDAAKAMLRTLIGKEALRFYYLMESDKLKDIEKGLYRMLITMDEGKMFTMPDELLVDSILTLSQLLQKHYKRKVIILIDEYDVPLDKAYQSGYYDDMVNLIRNLFGQALKSNDSLYFAVLTGCLRISKESIFTGLNNLNVMSITDVRFNEYFGFTDREVRELLDYYGLQDAHSTVKEWYDGYQFGNIDIYCPWDVINYCYTLCADPLARPQNYWANSSGNDIIRKFIQKAKSATKKEIEELISGGSIKKVIRQDLTYRDLDSSIDNLWSILFMTGYLTQHGKQNSDMMELAIPNKEICWIFTTQIQEWFMEEAVKDSGKLERFCKAFQENNTDAIEKGFTAYLMKTISIRDTSTRKARKENFYHGILLGLLGHMEDWSVSSNAETGEGYSDILIEIEEDMVGIVIELKYAENGAFEEQCQKALQQITEKRYVQVLEDDGMQIILKYGIACYKKRCKVVSG